MTVFAMPLNGTISTSTSTEPNTPSIAPDISIETYKKIPVTEVSCLGNYISPENCQAAKEAMIVWADSHWSLAPRSHHAQASLPKNSTDAVVWTVCNLKYMDWDPIPEKELDEVETILHRECGKHRAGRVYSRKWRKEYILSTYQWYKHHANQRHHHLCKHH
ncbi:hypothetical protein F5B18DRAFT_676123 [Nemania serpens]|nr:hypothetical protein F5B18DRAFT_676123 [Nemania serpens]